MVSFIRSDLEFILQQILIAERNAAVRIRFGGGDQPIEIELKPRIEIALYRGAKDAGQKKSARDQREQSPDRGRCDQSAG